MWIANPHKRRVLTMSAFCWGGFAIHLVSFPGFVIQNHQMKFSWFKKEVLWSRFL